MEKLKSKAVYMLRNDGELFKVNNTHPYIFFDPKDMIANVRELFTDIENNSFIWFYEHTKNKQVKTLMEDCIKSLINIINSDLACKIQIADISSIKHILDYFHNLNTEQKDICESDIEEYFSLLKYINAECNQEFLRLHIGGLYYGDQDKALYARVSSIDFDWFTLLWKLVYENRSLIDSITISTDEQAGRPYKLYVVDGQKIDNFPTNDFIELKGNPIIERNKALTKGISLIEAFNNYGPYHTYRRYKVYKDMYEEENFV